MERLEAAIGVLGEKNPHARPLLDALRVAKSRSKLPPVDERVEACRTFLERAKRRVARADEVITRAQEQKAVYVAEVEEAERGLALLQSEASVPLQSVVPEVGELQRQVSELVRERDILRSELQGKKIIRQSPERQCVPEFIPTMPGLVPGELAAWMDNRQVELQEALSNDNHIRALELSSKLAKGAERMIEMTRQTDIPDEEFRSRSAPGEGRFAPY